MNTWKLVIFFVICYGNIIASTENVVPVNIIPELENLFLNEEFINSITPEKLFTEKNGEFIEIHQRDIQAPIINGNNPYGIVDKMSDLSSVFLAEETTNINKARAALLLVKESAKFVQKFDGSSVLELPVGMKKEKNGTIVHIILNAIRVYPTHSALEVFVELKRPDWPTPLLLYSPDIAFTMEGGLAGISSVGLLGNIAIPLEDKKAILVLERGVYNPQKKSFESGTYMEFGCDGFEGFGLKGALHLSKEWAVPVLPNGNLDTVRRVVAAFDTEISGLDDMIFDVSIDEFVMPSVDRVAFTVTNAILDFSESEKRFDFPVGQFAYDPTINGDGFLPNNKSWKGIFIQEFGMRWVDSLAVNTQTSTMGIGGYDIVLDHNGFTGFVEVTGLLPLKDGQIDGWDFSIDRLAVGFLSSQPQAFEFNGELIVPLLKKDETNPNSNNAEQLSYLGSFDFYNRTYGIGVGLTEDKEFDVPLLKAVANISAGSELILEYREDEGFGIEAILHGGFEIKNAPIAGKKLNLPKITFQNLHIASQKDYIRNPGTWGLPETGGSFLGFGYNAKTIDLSEGKQKEDTEFRVIAGLNFTEGKENEDDGGIYISASGAFRLEGRIEFEGTEQKQRFNYKTLKVDMIEIEADLTSVYFYGQFIFFRDIDIWGTGFQGRVELYVAGANKKSDGGEQQPNMGIGALALFGTDNTNPNDEYRYFLIDVLARLGAGITIPNTGLKLKGIGGGVYYHMNQLSVTENIQDVAFDPGDPETEPDAYTAWMLTQIGVSLSGTQYLPDKSKLFGVNATVVISLEKEEAFNANITFSIQVNSNFGIDFIRMRGITNFMAPISWNAPSCSGVSAVIEMEFLFNNSSGKEPGFYANAFVFVNIAVANKSILYGNKLVSEVPSNLYNRMKDVCGVNNIKYAGALELELTKNSWFINLGRPDDRLEMQANYLIATVGLGAYLDIGTNIPAFPGLPPEVSNVISVPPIEEAGRATGLGFAFGATYNIGFGVNLVVLKGDLDVTAGFDIMAKQYDAVNCINNNNEPLGIYYWYAMGQAYAAVTADLSALGFSVFNTTLGAVLQFEGPNPFYGKGSFTGSYKLFRKTKSFYISFKFGEKCDANGTISSSNDVDYSFIYDLNPYDQTENIPVDKEIVASFNYPLDEYTSVMDEDGNETNYLLEIVEFSLMGPNNQAVNCELQQHSQYATLMPDEFLKSKQNYEATIKVAFINQSTGNADFEEELIHTFKTAVRYGTIPESNIEFAYPINGQYNYYDKHLQSSTFYIDLKQGQEYLFGNTSSCDYSYKFTSSFPTYEKYSYAYYSPNSDKIISSRPSGLIPGQAYRVQLIKVCNYDSEGVSGPGQNTDNADGPSGGSNNNNNSNNNDNDNVGGLDDPLNGNVGNPDGVNPNVGNNNNNNNNNNSNNNSDSDNSPPGNELPVLLPDEKVLYTFYFRNSKHEKFIDKFNSLPIENMLGRNAVLNHDEPFGTEEIQGFNDSPNILRMGAHLDNTSWYNNYKNYPIKNGTIHPYKSNSGRSDFNVAIQDNLNNNREEKYGNSKPYRAIDIVQPNSHLYTVNLNSLNQINQANQEGNIYQPSTAYIKYYIDSIIDYDIEYYINSSLNQIDWQGILDEIDIDQYNCSSINACCNTVPQVKSKIINAFQNAINQSDDIFKNTYYIDNSKCNHLIPENFQDKEAMVTHNLKNFPLEQGQYEVYFRYQLSEEMPVKYSDTRLLNKTNSNQ